VLKFQHEAGKRHTIAYEVIAYEVEAAIAPCNQFSTQSHVSLPIPDQTAKSSGVRSSVNPAISAIFSRLRTLTAAESR